MIEMETRVATVREGISDQFLKERAARVVFPRGQFLELEPVFLLHLQASTDGGQASFTPAEFYQSLGEFLFAPCVSCLPTLRCCGVVSIRFRGTLFGAPHLSFSGHQRPPLAVSTEYSVQYDLTIAGCFLPYQNSRVNIEQIGV